MIKVRIHGRGGQGSVTLAHMIAEAAYEEEQWAQAFPAFGVERRGAPVEAFARIGSQTITDRSQVNEPTYVIVQDPSIIEFVDVTDGLEAGGALLVNSGNSPAELPIETDEVIVIVNATEVARQYLDRPIMNTALLGAFSGVTDVFGLESVESVITSTFTGEIGRKNADAASAAFREVTAT